MDTIIRIAKIIFAYRKNPYLYFSGLLVSSGCILLSKSTIELIINFLLSLMHKNNTTVNLDNTLTLIAGIILIIIGIILFYYRFIRKPPKTIEYDNDTKVINTIFTEITTLNKLDFVIDQALYPYLIQSSLEEFDHLERYIQSSHYHVFNKTLKELFEKFFIAWNDVCKHWNAFTPTNVPDKLRPNTWLDIARTEDVQTAIEEVPEAAKVMHRNFQDLLTYIRNTYKDIGL